MSKTSDPIVQAHQLLVDTKAELLAILHGEEHGFTVITIGAGFDRMINQLSFLSANLTTTDKTIPEFPPVTEFMGERLLTPVKVETVETTPTEDKKAAFLEKVNNLQANLDTLDDDKIIEDYVTKEDIQAIRGVAKRAGLEDYKNATIDAAYLKLIRAGLKANAEAAQAKEDLNKSLPK